MSHVDAAVVASAANLAKGGKMCSMRWLIMLSSWKAVTRRARVNGLKTADEVVACRR